jgi:hypothetical protein
MPAVTAPAMTKGTAWVSATGKLTKVLLAATRQTIRSAK